MTLSEIAAAVTSEGTMSKNTSDGRVHPSPDEIARLAYQFYEARGRRNGRDLDDWLSAERELRHHFR